MGLESSCLSGGSDSKSKSVYRQERLGELYIRGLAGRGRGREECGGREIGHASPENYFTTESPFARRQWGNVEISPSGEMRPGTDLT